MRLFRSGNGINWALRLIVGGGFVLAGLLKAVDPAKFALDVAHYRLLPRELIHLAAILLPWMEVTAGLFVLAGIWLREAALVIAGFTVVFALAILSALARGLNIECGCFGTVGGRHVGLVNLAIDITFFSFASLLAARSGNRPANANFSEAGAQNAVSPLKASPRTSSATERVSRIRVW